MAPKNRISKWIYQLPVIEERFDRLLGSDAPEYAEEDFDKLYLDILRECCTILRTAEAEEAPDLDLLIKKLDDLFNEKILYWLERDHDTIESFVDDEDECPLILDEFMRLGKGTTDVFLLATMIFMKGRGGEGPSLKELGLPTLPNTWDSSKIPHPKTTRLARFRPDHPPYSISESTPLARVIYDARCEVQQKQLEISSKLNLSSGGSVVAFSFQGGWKSRTPYLGYIIPQQQDTDDRDFPRTITMELPLAHGVYNVATDESRKLILAADQDRIKSYRWGSLDDENYYDSPFAVHTLNSVGYSGPLFVTPDGRSIWRGSKDSLAVWNIEDLETHGDSGKDIIRGDSDGDDDDDDDDYENSDYCVEDTWRDEDDIEHSIGSTPHDEMTCIDPVNISYWHPHPQIAGTMFCAADTFEYSDYRCSVVNFDQGGKIVARYLGHGDKITGFSTSVQDPNVFVTACRDGHIRMFDLRRPLPVIMFRAKTSDIDPCTSALYIHPDGIPTIINGQEKTERVMVWDVRARAVVYELSTGNNSVESLLFDNERSTLYASTSRFVATEYRKSNLPSSYFLGTHQEDSDEYDSYDDDDDYVEESENHQDGILYSNSIRWPKQAYHPENFFGYAYDARCGNILRYEFKETPDLQQCPPSGEYPD